MLHISIEVTKLDEDIATRAVYNAYEGLTKVIPEDIVANVETSPHTSTRGIHSVVTVIEPQLMNSAYVQSLTSAFKALLSLQLYKTAAKVSVRTETVPDEEQE